MRVLHAVAAAALARRSPYRSPGPIWNRSRAPAAPEPGRRASAVKPDPSKIVVPKGYKVSVFVAGLDTPSAATVDGEGNVWVAISGPLFMQGTEPPMSRYSTRPAR